MESINPGRYAKTRNFLDGDVTQLSPYLTHGVIRTRDVLDYVLEFSSFKGAEKLIFELAWRDFFATVYRYHGKAIFGDLLAPQTPTRSQELPEAIIEANTSIKVLDKAVTKLYQTGYLHNHERMWLASVICNIAQVSWQKPARWFFYHLLDGDLASNTLSWQWVAGSFARKKYYANQENLNRYSRTEQLGTFIDHNYNDLPELDIPEPLIKTASLELEMPRLPATEITEVPGHKPVLLYHLWMLDPYWHKDDDATRVLVLEPSYVKTYPISQNRLDFILELRKNIPGLKLYVGEFAELKNLAVCPSITTLDHPSLPYWSLPNLKKEMPISMFDPPLKDYSSFFSYWKACQYTLRFRSMTS